MFGFIRPHKPKMLVEELAFYKSVYCGLCREVGLRYGRIFRFLLSYDFVFLTLLRLALQPGCFGIERKRCAVNPLKRVDCLCGEEVYRYPAATFAICCYHKLSDDIEDSRFFRATAVRALRLLFRRGYKKAAAALPQLDETIRREVLRGRQTERAASPDRDAACDPSAVMLGEILRGALSPADCSESLYRFGYMLGRFVYLADAVYDLREDFKSRSYNPFLCQYRPASLDEAAVSEIFEDAEKKPEYDPLSRLRGL